MYIQYVTVRHAILCHTDTTSAIGRYTVIHRAGRRVWRNDTGCLAYVHSLAHGHSARGKKHCTHYVSHCQTITITVITLQLAC